MMSVGILTIDNQRDVTAGTVLVRWQENSVVTVASNTFGIEPVGLLKRWSRVKSPEVSVPAIPDCIIMVWMHALMGCIRSSERPKLQNRCAVQKMAFTWI